MFISGFIPGLNNPKNTDSFLFPRLQHLAGLQKEKLRLWDAALQREVQSRVFLALLTTDGPGMMHITGFVGYHGKHGCRLYCGMAGRREVHGKQYFPALLKPLNYEVEGVCMPTLLSDTSHILHMINTTTICVILLCRLTRHNIALNV